ncbi:metallophosphoesterase, partial [Streptomyces sp. XM83C]|nr:metallophosphoesterase [Streptomyces sp. XM83C]
MVIVLVLVALLVLAVLVTANWYVWRRLFRDTTEHPGPVRRAGAVLIGGGWALAVGALVAERAGAPFPLQQALAWPGFLWLALSVYLLLALLAGEAVRPLLRRLPTRRTRAGGAGSGAGTPAGGRAGAEPEAVAEPVAEGARGGGAEARAASASDTVGTAEAGRAAAAGGAAGTGGTKAGAASSEAGAPEPAPTPAPASE